MRKILHVITKILFNVMAILFGLGILIDTVTVHPDIAALLTEHVFKDQAADVTVSTGKEPVRFKTWYTSIEDILDGNGQIAEFAQAEGTVLLKNDDNVLPLAAGTKVSLYGVTGYDPMYSIDGAGNNKINDPQAWNGKSEVYRRQFFYEEFEKVGFEMNEDLKNWYNSAEGKHYWRRDFIGFWGLNSGLGYTGNKNGAFPDLTEATWDEVNASAKNTAEFGKSTTAIYVTGRMGNESADMTSEGWGSSGAVSGGNSDGNKSNRDYLALTAEEKNLLQGLGENYDNVIVIFNQANPPQDNLAKIFKDYGVDAALWIGFPGSDGIKAVAEILAGKINPSGGLSSTWYSSRNANPSTQNFGFSGVMNVVNVEDMYVGYRYAETRYEDMLLGSANAGNYVYTDNISYPFGYGLSYSSFSYSDVSVVKDNDPEKNYYTTGLMAANSPNYTGNYGKLRPESERRATGSALGDCDDLIMKVKVTNTGATAGKEIVQVYLRQPITETDIQHSVQKPAVQLVGYGKTSILAPGASEVVEVKIDANKWFAAYDSRSNSGLGGYVLSAGDYKLVAARNSHEAVNSLYKEQGGKESDAYFDATYGVGAADRVSTVTVSDARSASYKYWTQGVEDNVQNLFSDIDPNMDSDTSNDVAFFSRYNWEETAAIQSNGRIGEDARTKYGGAKNVTSSFDKETTINSADIDLFETYYKVEFDETDYTFGWSKTTWQLCDLIGVEYDPARGASEEDVKKWAQLVGQMSPADFQRLFAQGLRKTLSVESIGKPGTNDQNASNGFEWPFGLGHGEGSGNFAGKNANYGFKDKFDPNAPIAYPTGYPCCGIRAASFNDEVALLVGQAIGEDGLWGGASGLYGFGLGFQRNPYHGRYGEFYSDDPYLIGRIGGYETKGAQMKGLYVYNKHFVLNDQESERPNYSSWLTEQTFRQMYLRTFEMGMEIGDAMNVMIAFNEIGDTWGGSNYNLMTRWLRDEAGMAGFALSDSAPQPGEQLGYGIMAGSCLLDGNTNRGYSAGADARYDNRLVEAAIRILYTVANSNAMNFIGDDTVTYSFEPLWYAKRDLLVDAITEVFAVSFVLVSITTVWSVFARRKEKTEKQGKVSPRIRLR